MAKIYVHVGMPKCASTLLQHVLAACERILLEKAGYAIWNQKHPSQFFQITCSELVQKNIDITQKLDRRVVGPNVGRWFQKIQHEPLLWNILGFYMCYSFLIAHDNHNDLINEIRLKANRVMDENNITALVISSEYLCNPSHSLDSLSSLLEGHEVQIIIVVRRQDKFLKSLYNMCVRAHALELRYEEWLKSPVSDQLFGGLMEMIHWDKTVNYFANRFGSRNVKLLFFEDLKKSATEFISAFFESMGLSLRLDDSAVLPKLNPSLSPIGMELLRHGNAVLPPDSAERVQYWQSLEQIFSNRPHQTKWLQDSADNSAEILEPYRDGNRRLIQEFTSNRQDSDKLLAYYTGEKDELPPLRSNEGRPKMHDTPLSTYTSP